MRAAAILAALVFASPAAAHHNETHGASAAPKDDAKAVSAALDACLSDATAPDACIGVAANPCIEGAGGEAGAVAACYGAETTAWQARLDASVATLHADAAAADELAASEAVSPTGTVDAAAGQNAGAGRVASLNDAQATWAAWRDAECRWHGTGFAAEAQSVAAAECQMKQTARRALSLQVRGQAVDGP